MSIGEPRMSTNVVEDKSVTKDEKIINHEVVVASQASALEQAIIDEAKAAEDALKATELAEQIKSGNIGVSVEKNVNAAGAENKNEVRGVADIQFKRMTEVLRGELEVALAEGDTQGFQEAYIKMTENKIAGLEFRAQALDEDFNDGTFEKDLKQARSSVEMTMGYVRGEYEYNKKNLQDQIQTLKADSIELVKSNPQAVIMREGYDEKRDGVNALRSILKEAGNYLALEKKSGVEFGAQYPNATAKVEGAVVAALRYKDPKVMAFLKETFDGDVPMTNVTLSPELQQQIHDLKV